MERESLTLWLLNTSICKCYHFREKACPGDDIPAFNVALDMITLLLYWGQMNGSPLPSELVVRRD